MTGMARQCHRVGPLGFPSSAAGPPPATRRYKVTHWQARRRRDPARRRVHSHSGSQLCRAARAGRVRALPGTGRRRRRRFNFVKCYSGWCGTGGNLTALPVPRHCQCYPSLWHGDSSPRAYCHDGKRRLDSDGRSSFDSERPPQVGRPRHWTGPGPGPAAEHGLT